MNDKSGRILVVDDNQINLTIAKKVLTNVGINVKTVQNGQQALDILEQETFDAVLMDIQMPVMDGYTATRHIRNNPKLKGLPIVAMSANVMTSDVQKALDAGMNAHVGKPLKIKLMLNTLAELIV